MVAEAAAAVQPAVDVADQAALDKFRQGLHEEILAAILGTVQVAAGLCTQICIDRLGALHEESSGTGGSSLPGTLAAAAAAAASVAASRAAGSKAEEAPAKQVLTASSAAADSEESTAMATTTEAVSEEDEAAGPAPAGAPATDHQPAAANGPAEMAAQAAGAGAAAGADLVPPQPRPSAGALMLLESQADGVAELTCEELHILIRHIASYATRPDVQEELAAVRGNCADWGPWLVATADDEDADTVLQVRIHRAYKLAWPQPIKVLRMTDLVKLDEARDEELKHQDIQELVMSFLRRRGATSNVLSMLSFLDFAMWQGSLDSIPLEQIEVAWALRLFPAQVATLAKQVPGGTDYASLRNLRKRVNELLKLVPQFDPSTDGHSLILKALRYRGSCVTEPIVPLYERSEDNLIRIGIRTIDLLNLQEIISPAAPRIWKGNRCQRSTIHKAIIVGGAARAETLYGELKRTSAVLFARAAPCRLNENLHDMGLELLTPEASLMLRAAAREHTMRSYLTTFGLKPLLCTAPHNIYLAQEGEPIQRLEEYTTHIAERFSMRVGGSSLVWSRREQYRSELRWAMAQRRGLVGGDSSAVLPTLDSENRDPGTMPTADVRQSEWFQRMAATHETFKAESAVHLFKASLHLDVLGCRGPPQHAHLTIGLGAMVQATVGGSGAAEFGNPTMAQVARFGQVVAAQAHVIIQSLRLWPEGEAVKVIIPNSLESVTEASGAFRPSADRQTLTQQAVMFAGFTHACQLEMSLPLRRALSQDHEAVNKLADTFWDSFTKLTN